MMLYKLYKNGNVKFLIDMSYYIEDVIDTLGYCLDNPIIDFSITEYDGEQEKEYVRIRSIEEYIKVINDNPKKLELENNMI